MRKFFIFSLTAIMGILLINQAHAGGAFDGFGGRWTGAGTLNMRDDSKELLKCIATYFPSAGNTQLKINVRCASPGYKIDAKGSLRSQGEKVFGEFEERNYEKRGSMSGTAGDGKIEAVISGEDWRAQLVIADHGTFVMLIPNSGPVRIISMVFSKG